MLVGLGEVQSAVLSRCSALPALRVPLAEALGLVLAEPVTSPEPVPPFANSAMDGYALRAQDVTAAPVLLAEVGVLMAGDDARGARVGPGEAVRIMTGAPLPEGADAVCMVESTRPGPPGQVWVDEAVPLGTSVRPAGDDLAPGDEVLAAGTQVGGPQMGLLATLGLGDVLAYRRPRVGVVSTGDELVASFGPLPLGKIRDSNRPALLAQLARDGFQAVDLGHVADDVDGLAAALSGATSSCDAILTSGGVSVGDRDVVKAVLQKLGGDGYMWAQVAVRPAKPFAFAPIGPDGTAVFGLPGNPVSALVSYELFARPALRAMAGHHVLHRPRLGAVADEALPRTPDGKTHLLRAVVSIGPGGVLHARLAGGQGSHQMRAMGAANALLVLPDGHGAGTGSEVEVILLDAERLAPFPAGRTSTGTNI